MNFEKEKLKNMDQTPFTFAGQCDDEVIFTFDNTNQRLFVSRNFLRLLSPVFRTMFTSDFTVQTTGVVEMKDTEYDHVLEFLLIPCEQKSVSEENVYSVLCLAEKFEVKILIQRCKSVLSEMLIEKFKVIENVGEKELRKTEAAHACIVVLSTALVYAYADLKTAAMKTISRFGSKVFLKDDVWGYCDSGYIPYGYSRSIQLFGFFGVKLLADWSGVESKRRECRHVYNTLPDDVKITILQNRVDLLEDDKTH